MTLKGEICGYLVLALSATHRYRGVDRQPFMPELTADMLAQSSENPAKRSHVWEFAQTGWEKEAFKIYEENLVASAPDDLPLIGDLRSAERIKDIVEPHRGIHEVVRCELTPLSMSHGLAQDHGKAAGENSLGYDAAYPGGEFYSAVLNGLFRNPHPTLLRDFRARLNEFGLFDGASDAIKYLEIFRSLVPTESNSEFALFRLFSSGGKNYRA